MLLVHHDLNQITSIILTVNQSAAKDKTSDMNLKNQAVLN